MVLASSSDPGVLAVVPWPSGRCSVLKLGFLSLWSSCTLNHKAFFLCLGAGSLCVAPSAISILLPSASHCAGDGVPAATMSLSLSLAMFYVIFLLLVREKVFTSISILQDEMICVWV